MSKYTAHQIYALGQFIIANQKYFPNYQIGQQIRHLEYNAQRNLPDDSEKYFQKYLGVTVEKAMEEAAKVQFELTQPPKETHAPPTSAPPEPPKRRVVVYTSCTTCGRDDVAIAEDDLNEAEAKGWPIFCSVECQQQKKKNLDNMITESDKFLQAVGARYYNCEVNTKKLLAYLVEQKKKVTSENLLNAFITIQDQLLKPLTPDDIRAMTDAEFDTRARLEGSYQSNVMGGVDLYTLQVKKPEATMHSSNKIRTYDLQRQGFVGQGGVR
jgi:hypothetical protein